MLTPVLIVVATFAAREQHVLASIHDCWDQEKLNRMKFPVSQREPNHFLFMSYLHDTHQIKISFYVSFFIWLVNVLK